MKMVRHIITEEEVEIPSTLKGFFYWEFSSGCTTGSDFKEFARLFKNYVLKNKPEESRIVGFSIGHYFVSGFLEKNGKYAYFSISDVRYFPTDWYQRILIRTATHEKDYTGGSNQYTTLENFREAVKQLVSS